MLKLVRLLNRLMLALLMRLTAIISRRRRVVIVLVKIKIARQSLDTG